MKTPLIANKELQPTVSFVLAMVLATYLTACSTVAMNQADDLRTAAMTQADEVCTAAMSQADELCMPEIRMAVKLANKERAAAKQAMQHGLKQKRWQLSELSQREQRRKERRQKK